MVAGLTPEGSSATPRAGASQSEWRLLPLSLLVFAVAAVTTLLFWAVLPSRFRTNENSDYIYFYEPVARAIVAGHGVVTSDGELAVRAPPGYPILLAGIFAFSGWTGVPEGVMLPAFCVLCMGVASVVLFAIARTFWGSVPSLLTAAMWMTYPCGLWLTKQPNSEIPFLVVFYLAVFLFLRLLTSSTPSRPLSFAVGVLAGVAMLIRPIAVGVGLVMASIVFLRYLNRGSEARRGLVLACLIVAGNLLAVTPWEAWLYSRTNKLVLLKPKTVWSIQAGLSSFADRHRAPEGVAELARDIERRFDREVHSYGDLARLLFEELRARPSAVLGLFLLKIVRSWYGTDSGRYEKVTLLIQIPYLALIGWSSIVAWRRNRPLALTVWALALYFWMMTLSALTIVRYMVPAIGLLFTQLPAILRSEKAALIRLQRSAYRA